MPSKCAWNRVIAAQCHWISWISSQPLYQTINPNVFPLKKSSKISWTWTCSQICFPSQESTKQPACCSRRCCRIQASRTSRFARQESLYGMHDSWSNKPLNLTIQGIFNIIDIWTIASTFFGHPCMCLPVTQFTIANPLNHNKLHIIYPVASCPRRISATCKDSRSAR